jgi:hypothetical protein
MSTPADASYTAGAESTANATSIVRYLGAAGVALLALMLVLQPDVGFSAPLPAMALFWALQIGSGLLVLQLLLYRLAQSFGATRLPTWTLVLASGVLGSALLAPLFWLIGEGLMQGVLQMPATPDDDPVSPATGLPTALWQEYFDIVGPVTASWLLICLPRLHWLVPPRLVPWRADTPQPVTRSETGAEVPRPGSPTEPPAPPMPRAAWQTRLPPALGEDIIAVASELQYLRVWTSRGCALILGAMSEVESGSGSAGLRVHRSWWVATRHVRRVQRSAAGVVCVLSDGRSIPVSRRRRTEVLARLGDGVTYNGSTLEQVTDADLH